MTEPLCFVVTPFGIKSDGQGERVDFDAIHATVIAPAIEAAGLQALRADEDLVGGVIHKPMYERLVLAEIAVVDLTTTDPMVLYQLGVRHAVRPHATVLIVAEDRPVGFDLAGQRVMRYAIDRHGRPGDPDRDRATLTALLREAVSGAVDSPMFQLLDYLAPLDIDRVRDDVFRQRVESSIAIRERLARARADGVDAVRATDAWLAPLEDHEAGVLVDLLLAYRAVGAFADMVDLVERLPSSVQETTLVREQYGFALGRVDRGEAAERVLLEVIDRHGPSSETYGLLGRIYKDRWLQARQSGEHAEQLLRRAIDAYRLGFEADWRDAYPGINAVTLMEVLDPHHEEQQRIIPVVRYAIVRRLERGVQDYWDLAGLLELGVLARDRDEAAGAAARALAAVRERWEAESTANNLAMIRRARETRDDRLEWAEAIERDLRRAGDA